MRLLVAFALAVLAAAVATQVLNTPSQVGPGANPGTPSLSPAAPGATGAPSSRLTTPGGSTAETPASPRRATRPNVIFVLTDDQWTTSMSEMPLVDRLLGGHGVTFDNMFVTTPLCCPSRASILTGRYSRSTGVLDNTPPNGGVTAFDDDSTIATWLRRGGYTTSYIGRYLNGYESLGARSFVPPGWDDWHGLAKLSPAGYSLNENGKLVAYGSAPADYLTDVLRDKALRFIRGARSPFFLTLATFAPHFPATPAARDAGSSAAALPYRPPSFNELDVSDKAWGAAVPPLGPKEIAFADTLRRLGLESLQAVDRAVAAVVSELSRTGLLDDTLIFFTSDNGYLFGEHRLVGKQWPYEPSIRVPLIVRAPWISSPRVERRLVLNVDLAATFADLAGVKPGRPQQGRSFVPLLRGERTEWRGDFFFEYLGDAGGFEPIPPPRYEGVRTDRWKLVEYLDGGRELYDLQLDPFELSSVAGDPSYATIERDLAARLVALRP